MARRVIEHKDFTGGDWGRRQPWNAAPNSFKATNMLLYTTGELGVRPGIQNITPTNVAAGSVAWGIAGDVLSAAYYYGQGTSMRRATAFKNQAQTTMTGSFTPGTPSNLYYAKMGSQSSGNALYIMSESQGVYSLIAGTLTKLNTVGGNGLAFYGDRLCTGFFAGTTASVRYNGLTAGVSDLTNWPAANIIPVGDRNERPANLFVQRGHLSIMKTTNGLFVITGALGVNEVLRRAVNTIGPPDGFVGASSITENDTIWFVADNRHRIPASFDGTRVRYYEDQLLPVQGDGLVNMTSLTVTDPHGVVITTGSSTVPTFGVTTKMHIFYRGVWTRHELPALGNNSQMACTTNVSAFDPGFDRVTPPEDFPYNLHDVPAVVFCDNSAATPVFYSLLLDLDRPGYKWDDLTGTLVFLDAEMPGDNSSEQVSGTLELPEVHLKDADEFMVQGVIVDFRSWDTNGTLNNHFDVQVDCLRTYDNTSPITSLTSSWDEVGNLSSTNGTIKRQVFMFGEQGYGNGYQIKMDNIRGIAIQRIQVILDTVKMRGV